MSDEWLTQEEAAEFLGMTLEKFKERGPAPTKWIVMGEDPWPSLEMFGGANRWSKRNLILWRKLYASENP